ncbi:uncharacterized protein LOC135206469 [Macrobrachium nipponense]|uniref:uncharacterized protein LOC135206469 n=1 Tax=Macrobrachium nipponense TaxID=159736 RepID=UPI0030C7A41B
MDNSRSGGSHSQDTRNRELEERNKNLTQRIKEAAYLIQILKQEISEVEGASGSHLLKRIAECSEELNALQGDETSLNSVANIIEEMERHPSSQQYQTQIQMLRNLLDQMQ